MERTKALESLKLGGNMLPYLPLSDLSNSQFLFLPSSLLPSLPPFCLSFHIARTFLAASVGPLKEPVVVLIYSDKEINFLTPKIGWILEGMFWISNEITYWKCLAHSRCSKIKFVLSLLSFSPKSIQNNILSPVARHGLCNYSCDFSFEKRPLFIPK